MSDSPDFEGLFCHILQIGTERPQGRLLITEAASQFRVDEGGVWEALLRMETLRLIVLSRWDGRRDLPVALWGSVEDFKACQEDDEYVRIITGPKGLDLLCDGR